MGLDPSESIKSCYISGLKNKALIRDVFAESYSSIPRGKVLQGLSPTVVQRYKKDIHI